MAAVARTPPSASEPLSTTSSASGAFAAMVGALAARGGVELSSRIFPGVPLTSLASSSSISDHISTCPSASLRPYNLAFFVITTAL